MNIRIVPIEQINSATDNPRVELQPGDWSMRSFAAALRSLTMWSRLSGTNVLGIWSVAINGLIKIKPPLKSKDFDVVCRKINLR